MELHLHILTLPKQKCLLCTKFHENLMSSRTIRSVVGHRVADVSKNCQAVQKLFLGCLCFVYPIMVSLSSKTILEIDKLNQVRVASCLKYNINIYNIIVTHNFVFYQIILGYNYSYMFRPNCRAIFRLIFEQVECTIDNAFNLRDLLFVQELVKIIVACYI